MIAYLLTLFLFLSPFALPASSWYQRHRFKSPLYENKIDLSRTERTIYSQNGEDGVIHALFELLGTGTKYCVEFGGYDGEQSSNTLYLRKHGGWTGLLWDSSHQDPSINLYQEFITAENINHLFEKYQVPADLDFLSIDIDYNDFHVWQALEEKYRPRVIVIEYNASLLPHEDKVAKYYPTAQFDGTNYYGASILAFYNLARKKGYSLVYAEKRGVNLFFVRDDLIENCSYEFLHLNDVEKLYATPKYGTAPDGGHPYDTQNREWVSSEELLAPL